LTRSFYTVTQEVREQQNAAGDCHGDCRLQQDREIQFLVCGGHQICGRKELKLEYNGWGNLVSTAAQGILRHKTVSATMRIVINGELRAVPPNLTLLQFIHFLQLDPELVAVEMNPAHHQERRLAGDRVARRHDARNRPVLSAGDKGGLLPPQNRVYAKLRIAPASFVVNVEHPCRAW